MRYSYVVASSNVTVFYMFQIHQLSCANQEPVQVQITWQESSYMNIRLHFNDRLDEKGIGKNAAIRFFNLEVDIFKYNQLAN